MRCTVVVILLLCVVCSVWSYGAETCTDPLCSIPPPYGVVGQLCMLNNVTIADNMCTYSTSPIGVLPIASCKYKVDRLGTWSVGPCGCPNSCSGRGKCEQRPEYNDQWRCACQPGWKGPSCSAVSCSTGAYCSGRGKCSTVMGQDTCVCGSEYTGQFCASDVVTVAEISETISGDRFDNWDDYGLQHPVFNESVIAQVRISMNDNDLRALLDPANSKSDMYMQSDMWFYNGLVQDTLTDVGIRLGGSLMKLFPKKCFKLSFTEFSPDRRWYQLKHLLFKSAALDPSYIREMASAAISYSMNSPVYRSSWAELWINDISWGLYVMYEDMDNQFFKSRLGSDETPVYKTHWGANFSYLGSDPTIYQNLWCDPNPCYDPQTDQANDYSALANLISVLNLTPDDKLESELSKVLDVNAFLQAYVMEVATSNWDGIANQGNNIFLYLNDDGQFVYWRHDLDLSWGFPMSMGLPIVDLSQVDPYKFTDNVLAKRVLSVSKWRDKYTSLFYDLLDTYFMPTGKLMSRIETLKDLGSLVVVADQMHQACMGFSTDDFEVSLIENFGYIISITEYTHLRIDSLQQSLDPR
ncbi:Spore coat protein H [Pelomyxa schiedti]|nr:Spore coat protein H [Pelomyxa schiedti]